MLHLYVTTANEVKLHPGMMSVSFADKTTRFNQIERVEVSPIKQRNFTTKLSRIINTASYATESLK